MSTRSTWGQSSTTLTTHRLTLPGFHDAQRLRGTNACTGVRESGGFEMDNLSSPPGYGRCSVDKLNRKPRRILINSRISTCMAILPLHCLACQLCALTPTLDVPRPHHPAFRGIRIHDDHAWVSHMCCDCSWGRGRICTGVHKLELQSPLVGDVPCWSRRLACWFWAGGCWRYNLWTIYARRRNVTPKTRQNNAVHTEDGIARLQMENQLAVPTDHNRYPIESWTLFDC